MHILYFVKITDAENSQEAREKATQVLDDNNFASDSNGFFGNSKADWYVVGGRWSGILSGNNDQQRDNYAPLGHEDDAMKITPELLKTLKAEYGDSEIFLVDEDSEDESIINHLDITECEGDWIVVIDYHE